jgi:hypothetical protein
MQLFCFGLCDSVGLVGVNVALYAQTEPKIFSAKNATHCLAKLALVQRIRRHDFLRV